MRWYDVTERLAIFGLGALAAAWLTVSEPVPAPACPQPAATVLSSDGLAPECPSVVGIAVGEKNGVPCACVLVTMSNGQEHVFCREAMGT